MDKDRVKGAIDQVVGSTKRQVGNLTGNKETQVKGAIQQVKGKVESAWGKAKDTVRDANGNLAAPPKTNKKPVSEHRKVVVTEERKSI